MKKPAVITRTDIEASPTSAFTRSSRTSFTDYKRLSRRSRATLGRRGTPLSRRKKPSTRQGRVNGNRLPSRPSQANLRQGGALASSGQTAEADALFATAKRAYTEGDHWRAIQLCQQAIEIVGDKADYYHLLGLSLAENPKWRADAARNLQIAAKLDPRDAKYFVALGELYEKSGLRVRAKRAFEQAKAIDPNYLSE